MKSVIVGASSGLGRALAVELARAGHALVVTARREAELAALAEELRRRFGARVTVLAADVAAADPADYVRAAAAALDGTPDNLFWVAGVADRDRDLVGAGPDVVRRQIEVNFAGAVRFLNAFAPAMRAAGAGNVVGVGSIAAARARNRNVVYGAAKRGLEFYFQALRHYFQATGVRVQFYRFGYMATAMSAGARLRLPAITPEAGARAIVGGLGRDLPCRHVPGWWYPITLILRALPWAIYRRLDF